MSEHDPSSRPDTLDGTEREETVSCANVQDDVTGAKLGVVEHPITDRQQVVHRLTVLFLIIAISAMEEPLSPLVEFRLGHRTKG